MADNDHTPNQSGSTIKPPPIILNGFFNPVDASATKPYLYPIMYVDIVSMDWKPTDPLKLEMTKIPALIDTGAASTGISPTLAKQLGLEKTRTGSARTTTAPVEATGYAGRIRLADDTKVFGLELVGYPGLDDTFHRMIIGWTTLYRYEVRISQLRDVVQLIREQ